MLSGTIHFCKVRHGNCSCVLLALTPRKTPSPTLKDTILYLPVEKAKKKEHHTSGFIFHGFCSVHDGVKASRKGRFPRFGFPSNIRAAPDASPACHLGLLPNGQETTPTSGLLVLLARCLSTGFRHRTFPAVSGVSWLRRRSSQGGVLGVSGTATTYHRSACTASQRSSRRESWAPDRNWLHFGVKAWYRY